MVACVACPGPDPSSNWKHGLRPTVDPVRSSCVAATQVLDKVLCLESLSLSLVIGREVPRSWLVFLAVRRSGKEPFSISLAGVGKGRADKVY